MNNKIKAAIEDILNTAIHATVAALATGIPASFSDWGADRAWLLAALAAGLVAGIHALGRILVAVKNAQYNTNLVATPVGDEENREAVWLAQTVIGSAPPESTAHAKALDLP